jgi:hypothetical protein
LNKFILIFSLIFSLNSFSQGLVTEWSDDQFFQDEVSSEVQSNDKSLRSVLFLINPAKIKFTAEYTPENLVNIIDEYRTRALSGEFLGLGINTGYIEMDVKGDKAKLVFFSSRLGALEKALKMKISPKGDHQLKIEARVPYCHMKELYKASNKDEDRWGFSKQTERKLKNVLAI